MRFIDGDALYDNIKMYQRKNLVTCVLPKDNKLVDALTVISECPTIEEAHGYWTIDYDEDNGIMFICSSCEKFVSNANGYRYCPYCGAVMEKV